MVGQGSWVRLVLHRPLRSRITRQPELRPLQAARRPRTPRNVRRSVARWWSPRGDLVERRELLRLGDQQLDHLGAALPELLDEVELVRSEPEVRRAVAEQLHPTTGGTETGEEVLDADQGGGMGGGRGHVRHGSSPLSW